MYADKVTKSMQNLIDETKRRRKIQSEYNIKNNITPKTIKKSDKNLLQSMIVNNDSSNSEKIELKEINYKVEDLDTIEILDLIEKSKRKMKNYAKNFQFEEAAIMRDQIIKLNEKIKA